MRVGNVIKIYNSEENVAIPKHTHTKKGVLIVRAREDHFTSAMQVAIKKHYVPRLQGNFQASNFVVC